MCYNSWDTWNPRKLRTTRIFQTSVKMGKHHTDILDAFLLRACLLRNARTNNRSMSFAAYKP